MTRRVISDEAPQIEQTQSDLPPEYHQYHDEGCELATSCLSCPFSRCLYDEPGGKRHYLKLQRDLEIVRLHEKEGKVVKELAVIFGVSRRTVQRVLRSKNDR
ncbi:MAG: hypothetical protein V1894_06015 [Chloroflexota bacterium]